MIAACPAPFPPPKCAPKYIYVGVGELGKVEVIDTTNNKDPIAKTIPLGKFANVTAIAITPDDAKAYVADNEMDGHKVLPGKVFVINTSNNDLENKGMPIKVDGGPLQIAIFPYADLDK